MEYKTLDINDLSDNIAQHICFNDTLDIVVIKENQNYKVKVLSVPNDSTSTELIDYDEYAKLLELE